MGILGERNIILLTVCDLKKAMMGGLMGKSVRISFATAGTTPNTRRKFKNLEWPSKSKSGWQAGEIHVNRYIIIAKVET